VRISREITKPEETSQRTLLGIAIIAVAVVITTRSVEPTVGKTPTVSVDPLGLMTTAVNLPQAHYTDYSTIY
jgi:hypothetical protein